MKLIHGDSIEELKKLDENSVDTIITDPPYGLSFMGKKWDYDVPSVELWTECLRVLKPGGTLLTFAGSRTSHRMAVSVEDAGFEIFDTIMWLYGQGFPKSHNIEKALLKKCTCGTMEAHDNETKQSTEHSMRPVREQDVSQTINPENKQGEVLQSGMSEQSTHSPVLREEPKEGSIRGEERILDRRNNSKETERQLQGGDLPEVSTGVSGDGKEGRVHNATQASDGSISEQVVDENGSGTSRRPQSEQQQDREPCAFCQQFRPQEVRAWSGWGTALKPSYEPIICARKKVDGTYANNALKHGVSGLNIDGGRIGTDGGGTNCTSRDENGKCTGHEEANGSLGGGVMRHADESNGGRFPANIILDEEAGEMLDEQSGVSKSTPRTKSPTHHTGSVTPFERGSETSTHTDSGGASRFFYCAKASKKERNAGCEGLEDRVKLTQMRSANGTGDKNFEGGFQDSIQKNTHPTVKPLALMEYLVKLTATPTGGTVLDPFMGSGTTGVACKNEGRDFIGIEREAEYIEIAKARINN